MSDWPVRKSMFRLLQRVMVGVFRATALKGLRVRWRAFGYPPCDVRGITPSFLTRTMRESGVLPDGVSITHIACEQMEAGATGDVSRARLSYSRTVASLPETVILKVVGQHSKSIILNATFGMTEREQLAYRDLGAAMKGIMPACHAFDLHWTGAGVLVLEDLGRKRAIKSRHSESLALRDARTFFTTIGRIHGMSWENTDLVRPFLPYSESHPIQGMVPKIVARARSSELGAQVLGLPAIARLAEAIDDFDFYKAVSRKTRGHAPDDPEFRYPRPFVLCHGDTRLDNTFFDDERGEAILVDWQIPQVRHPICDVAWALLEVPLAMVTESLPELFQAYLAGVAREAPHATMLTEAELRAALPYGLINAWLVWIVLLASIVRESANVDENANPVAFTFSNIYAPRLDALLAMFAPAELEARGA